MKQAARDYPLAAKIVELSTNAIEQIAPEGRKPGFHAGYLMGKRKLLMLAIRL